MYKNMKIVVISQFLRCFYNRTKIVTINYLGLGENSLKVPVNIWTFLFFFEGFHEYL